MEEQVARNAQLLLQIFTNVGIFVFAISGAVAGIQRRADLFGVVVLAFAAAYCGGGMVRDILLAQVPQVVRTEIYATASLLGGAIAVAGRVWPIISPFVLYGSGGCCLHSAALSCHEVYLAGSRSAPPFHMTGTAPPLQILLDSKQFYGYIALSLYSTSPRELLLRDAAGCSSRSRAHL